MTSDMTPSWYDVLDVAPDAPADEIRAAWRSAIADLEPGSRRFATLNQAAEVLLDEQRRAAYDAELAPQASDPVTEPASKVVGEPSPEPQHDGVVVQRRDVIPGGHPKSHLIKICERLIEELHRGVLVAGHDDQ